MAKKQKKSLETDLLEPIIQSTDDELYAAASWIAHIIVGVNPYLDISTVQLVLMDGLSEPATEENGLALGKLIAKRARISIPEDSYGGTH